MGEHLKENDTEAVDIRRRPYLTRVAVHLFRGHVRRRSENAAWHRDVDFLIKPSRQSEIHHDRFAVAIDHDVVWLEVAVDNPELMCLLQSAGNFLRDGGDRAYVFQSAVSNHSC